MPLIFLRYQLSRFFGFISFVWIDDKSLLMIIQDDFANNVVNSLANCEKYNE